MMSLTDLRGHLYELPLITGQIRRGLILEMVDDRGCRSLGEIAPLPIWSQESLAEALEQFNQKHHKIMEVKWTLSNCFEELKRLDLFPSVCFGLESALMTLLAPINRERVELSALLMGTQEAILKQAELRYAEGYRSAKLKVASLSFDQAADVIETLKKRFYLRIDVNRAWATEDSLEFFRQFPLGTFDYVEEPFCNPQDLHLFSHPLAVDESFPQELCLQELERLPKLKALIYKPTIQGGLARCIPLYQWAKKRGVQIVLSSSFETEIGLAQIALMAQRLGLKTPLGLGTYHHVQKHLSQVPEFAHFLETDLGVGLS
jgi:O-succinylbenzoate synthase